MLGKYRVLKFLIMNAPGLFFHSLYLIFKVITIIKLIHIFFFKWPFRYFAITSRVSSYVRWKHQSFRFEQVGFKWHQ